MTKSKTATLIILLVYSVNVFSQKIILCGQMRGSHIINIESTLDQLKSSGAKYRLFIAKTATVKPQKIDLTQDLASQLTVDAATNYTKNILINKLSNMATTVCRDNPKKKAIMVCINKFTENIPLPYNCQRIELSEFLENSIIYKKFIILLALTPNHIELELEKPDVNNKLEESIIDIKGNIKSNAEISSIRYQIGNKGWQNIDKEQLTYKNGMVSFWLQNQWPYTSNIQAYLSFEIIDNEGNKTEPELKFGPFTKIDKEINPNNCYFKYYKKDIHDVALVRNFKSSNVYWFPIYSEVDPSNLSFVLVNKLGQQHISIKLKEDINFVKSSTNEYCIVIGSGDLLIGSSDCTLQFKGSCMLIHNENNSKSLPIDIFLKDWKPTYTAPLAECSK